MSENTFDSQEINLQFQPLPAFIDTDGSFKLNTPMLSSFDFDGSIPKRDEPVDAIEVKPGYLIQIESGGEYFPVVSVEYDEPDIEDTGIVTINYIDDQGNTISADYDETDQISAVYEDWEEKILGSQGWGITAGGNAIFTNVAVRGDLEATTLDVGGIDGITYDGNTVTIGASVVINAPVEFGGGSSSYVTLDYLSASYANLNQLATSGTTIINGGNIITGTISAARLDSSVIVSSELSTPGATIINGANITTGTINANLITTGSITSAVISGNTIKGGTITGQTISGGTISGTSIRTATSGARVEMGSAFQTSGLIAIYNSSTVAGYVFANLGSGLIVTGATGSPGVQVGGASEDVKIGRSLTVTESITSKTISTEANTLLYSGYRTTTTAGNTILRLSSNVTNTNEAKFEVDADGDVRSRTNSYAGFSDARYKENIEPARNYLDDLRQVEVVTFNWQNSDQKLLGVTAQQIQPIFPSMVAEDEGGTLSVRYSVFVPMLITAAQSLANKVDDLFYVVQQQQESIEDLQNRVLQLESQLGG